MRFDAKEFGGRIRDLRKKKGITQEQLSIMLNVSANHLAKVETGSRCCSIELLQDLSSCLNVRTDYLLNGDAPHNNHLRERLTFLAQELEKITACLLYTSRSLYQGWKNQTGSFCPVWRQADVPLFPRRKCPKHCQAVRLGSHHAAKYGR